MADTDSDESPSQPVRAPPASFSVDSIREIELEFGLENVSRAKDYPRAGGQAPAPARPRATTNPGGREESERGRPRANTAATRPLVAPSPRPSRSQYHQLPGLQGRQRPSPSPEGQSMLGQQARSSSRSYQPAMTPIQEATAARRPSRLAPASSAADGAPGPSRSQGADASAPTVAQAQGYNWDPPNRRAASGARDPRACRTGRSGRPLGQPLASRPRPPSATTNPGMAYPATLPNQESERFYPRTYQEETEQAMGRLNLGPRPGPDERDRARGRAREREDRSGFAWGSAPFQRSLSGRPQYQYEPHIRSPPTTSATSQYQPPIHSTSAASTASQFQPPARATTTASTSTDELDAPMSASALPGWDTGYFSVEQAAVALANTDRRTTVYIDSGIVMPTHSSASNDDGEESEDDFS